MRYLALISLLLTSTLLARVDARLANQQLAYYGPEFYQNFPKNVTKESLFRILSGTHQSVAKSFDKINNACSGGCYSHVSLGYDTARKIMFGELHDDRDARGTFVKDVYCGKKFYFRSVDDVRNMGNDINTEHTWPQSKFNRSFAKDMQKSDLHHLYPTDSDANNRRANHHFGNVDENEDELNLRDCSISRLARGGNSYIFAPPYEHRGNVARSLFYFATRYKMDIEKSEEIILRQWHKLDPIDEAEKQRHEAIAKHQGVRNPFIDYPELVDALTEL